MLERTSLRAAPKVLTWSGLIAVVGFGLGACAVGPAFQQPAPPNAHTYVIPGHLTGLQPGRGETSQHLVADKVVPEKWWQMFGASGLNVMVRQSLAANRNVEAAQYTLAQAHQQLREAGAAYAPQIDAGAYAERQKGPAVALGIRPDHTLPVYNLYAVGATVGFVPDVFGLTKRRVEQQRAEVANRAYQLAALQLSVIGNVVTQSIRMAAARQEAQVVAALVANDEQTLALVRQRTNAGKVARMNLDRAQAQLESDRTLLPPLQREMATSEAGLAVLLGRPPAAWTAPELSLNELVLPARLPLTLPSELVRQRPDILAAEARLHAAGAAVGVADAQMYPQFTLSASLGTASLTKEALGSGSSLVWTLLGGLTAPIFHGGALRAQKRAAIDHFHAELALYRNTVLQGLEQVADVLYALDHHAEVAALRRSAWGATAALQKLQKQRYLSGEIGQLDWRASRRKTLLDQLAYLRAETDRYLDSADLMVALGGNWPSSTGLLPCRRVPGGSPPTCTPSSQSLSHLSD